MKLLVLKHVHLDIDSYLSGWKKGFYYKLVSRHLDQDSHLLSHLWRSQWWGCLLWVNGDGIDTVAKWSVLAGGWFHLPRFPQSYPKGLITQSQSTLFYPSLGKNHNLSTFLYLEFVKDIGTLCNDNANIAPQIFWLSSWLKSAVAVYVLLCAFIMIN